jgi:hypothetical protein
MPSDPNGWPDEAREAMGRAMNIADGYDAEGWEKWADQLWRPKYKAHIDAALSALAPFVAAALAQARRDALEEAARIAEETGAGWFDQRTFTAQTIAAAIRAKADRGSTACQGAGGGR